ncbi:DUF4381 domain-containing protein [Vibrio nomapromontoriensis]|uniref:DUF4381 domain-containing protein n=1 Tax=Vibrio nomapromontoriensis TaxID=2910246 RepID=UPI003D136DD0
MSKNNILLKTLIDPTLPPSVDFYPETVGWKLVLVIVFIASASVMVRFLRRYRSNRYRRTALKAIRRLSKADAKTYLMTINSILKQVACYRYPHTSVASLYDEQWLMFLTSQTTDCDFTTPIARLWQRRLYTPQPNNEWTSSDLMQLESMACDWIKYHR